ncbi:hypothetical protein HPO96_10750 [Kribbella sandramycini]|uniref:Uncharacterized protein n=1 Tax=Kribbella sandramycini TaxID=60450 RepID=A0A7Y4KXZ1_9ACTN|nr:hypothetical protein [Kribbella sandramycini]MBB6569440.1 hypothetical protein [Kribbella sandramycini]NOL40724.1 hypothetical protein [Kribbella sandramycini]
MTGLTDALKGLAAPFRALVVAVLGAFWAWQWFTNDGLWAILAALAALLLGLTLDALGRRTSPANPHLSIALMEWWIVVPMVLAALAAATTIVITVELVAPETATPETKETIGALATAITAFLASGFIDWAADDTDSRTSDRIRDHFYAKYATTFQDNSPADLYVYSTTTPTGWSRTTRRTRADGIKSRWHLDRVPTE